MAGIGATRAFQPEPRREATGAQEADPFLAFNSETPDSPPAPIASPFVPPLVGPFQPQAEPVDDALHDPPYKVDRPVDLTPVTIGLCVGLAGIATAGVLYFQLSRTKAAGVRPPAQPAAVVETHGIVEVNSRPEGAKVLLDGKLHGATPLKLSLERGTHEIELQNGDARRKLPITIAGGETISQGVGAATLGDPLNALAWLAEASIAVGDPLRAGEVVLSGALGPMAALTAGDYRVEIDGFDPLLLRAVA